MAYAIIRVTKIASREQAQSVAHHNYRTQETPNADPALRHLNQELINHEQRSYWDLASERIAELQLPRLRKDAVRCVEVLLTASEEKFPKDPVTGQRADIRGSQWVQDNVVFLQKRYGAENVIGCMLHQDESTPHLHALVVPVTQQQRLSARDLFSPVALRQLQTDYANAMAPYGLKRGIEHSTAIHQDIRRFYGAQKTSQQELAELTKPLVHEPFQLPPLKAMERVSPQAYLEREQARMNEHLARQVAAVNAKLEQVSIIATANTLAQDRVRVLEKQLATSKQHERRLAAQLAQITQALTEKEHSFSSVQGQYHRLIVRTLQGEGLSPNQTELGHKQQTQSRQRAEQLLTTTLRGPVTDSQQVKEVLDHHGFKLVKNKEDNLILRESETAVQLLVSSLQINGRPLQEQMKQAIERTKQEQLQQKRLEVARHPHAMHATITMHADKATRVEAALEKAGASVWKVMALPDKRTALSVSYVFDWSTVESINTVFRQARQAEGVVVQEDYTHRTKREGAVRMIERERQPPSREQGLSM